MPAPDNIRDRTEHILGILNGTRPASVVYPMPMQPSSWRDVADSILAQLDQAPSYGLESPPLPSSAPGPFDFLTREWDDARDRPLSTEPRDTGYAPAEGTDVGFAGAADVPNTPDEDQPRIVAVLPHRGDRDIAEDILARMAETDAARAREEAAGNDEAHSQESQPQATQIAQAPVPWSPHPASPTASDDSEASGYIPAAAEDSSWWRWITGRKEPPLEGAGSYVGPSRTYDSSLRPTGQQPNSDNRNITPKPGEPLPGTPAERVERHHIYPQQYRYEFEKRGIDIDHPAHIIEIPWRQHRGAETGIHSRGYNERWGEYFREHPESTADHVHAFGRKITKEIFTGE